MRPPTSFKQEFLKKWLVGLKICGSSMKNINLLQRKKTIKLSADVAMASARARKTSWSRALVDKASKQDDGENKILVEKMLATYDYEEKLSTTTTTKNSNIGSYITSKKILRRSCSLRRTRKCAPNQRVLASSIAKKLMVKKKTEVLKSLVPGGESMDDFSNLLEETLDYIFSLRAQVDVMRRVVNASQVSICK